MRVLDAVVVAASLSISATVCAATLRSSTSPVDGKARIENPGCGFAGGGWTDLTPDISTNGVNLCGDRANCTKLWSMHKFSKGYFYSESHYAHITNGFVGGVDIPLTDQALLSVSNSLLKCRMNGGTCIPRFAYTWDGWGGAEPDDFEVVIGHIAQIGGVLAQFRDVVPAVECGMIGAYGEMHTSRYAAAEYQNRVVGAWLAVLPTNMALLVRSPPVWMKYLQTTTSAFFGGGMESMDQALRSRMGFYNDGYLGTDYDYGTWGAGGGRETWSRDEGRAFLRGQSVPYGGEFAGVSASYFDDNVHLLDPSRFNIVAEWYDTHLSYLRTIRAYDMTVVQNLTNTFFSSARWAFDGMPDLSEYEGADLRKFCEDHMGYRYVVRSVGYEGNPGCACVRIGVENTGFGTIPFDVAAEVVLSGEAGVFAVPVRGGGVSALRALAGGASAELSFEFDYPAQLPAGEYDVMLRTWAPLDDERTGSAALPRRPVRFANEGSWDGSQKANRICRVALCEAYDLPRGELWFAWNDACRAALGGRWLADGSVNGFVSQNFEIDSGVPRGKSGEACVEMVVDAMAEIPCPDGGAASFVFLAERDGSPVPYGYCVEGWKRLSGYGVVNGQRVVLRIRLSGKRVSYMLDDVPLVDETGGTWLQAAASPSSVSRLSLVGGWNGGDFCGTFGAKYPVPATVMTIK